METYKKATTEKHPDIRTLRIINEIKENFSYFSSPCLPKSYQESLDDL